MLTKIKESFLRAWRGEESFGRVLKVWGGSGLIVGIINIILFVIAVLSYSEKIIFKLGLITFIGYLYIYITLIIIHKNCKIKNLLFKIIINLLFIIFYLVLLKPFHFNLMMINII